jgi:hypothetical protein
MLIKTCLDCKFHEVKEEGGERISRCLKENCYAQYSKCVAGKALDRFLEQESLKNELLSSTFKQTYGCK